MTTIAETFKDREAKYGDFDQVSDVAQHLKQTFLDVRILRGQNVLSNSQKEALDMIATKIARIVCGDPNQRDSWADVAGYSTLIAESLEEK